MTAPLFDPDKCDNIGSVPSLDFDFVSECSIAAPPPPIFDCNPPIVPRDPPFPCPTIEGGSFGVRTGILGCAGVPDRASGVVTVTRTDLATCRFLIDLDLDLPLPQPPCPTINGGSVGLTVNLQRDNCDITGPTGVITVTKTVRPFNCSTNSQGCEFDIDLNLAIPIPPALCPGLDGGSVNINTGYAVPGCVSGPTGALRVTKDVIPGDCNHNDSCRFTIDLDLSIPTPVPPCPTISGGSVGITTGFADCVGAATGAVTVTKTETAGDCNTPPTCEFAIDLDLNIPVPRQPCPAIEGGSVTVNVGYDDCIFGPGGRVIVNKTETPGTCSTAPSCQFAIDLELDIPIPKPPCPTITAAGVINYTNDVFLPTMVFSVETGVISGDCDTADECAFDFSISIRLPPPPCPTIEAGSVGVNVGYGGTCTGPSSPTGAIVIHKKEKPGTASTAPSCQFTIDLDLDIPIPTPPCPTITASGVISYKPDLTAPTMVFSVETGVISGDCSGPDECTFDFKVEIEFPPPVCPEITGTINVYETTQPTGTLEVTPTTGPNGECQFNIDVEIGLPPPACPEITGALDVYEASQPTGKLEITPTTGPDGQCQFDINLEIGVPQACVPEITASGIVRVTPGVEEPTMVFSVEATGCKYDFNMELLVPPAPACPEITGALSVYETSQPTGTLEITPTTGPGGACTFDINLEIGVPQACVPEITASGVVIVTPGVEEPTMVFSVEATGCKYDFNMELLVPVPAPCPEITGTLLVYETSQPTGTFTANPVTGPNGECQFNLDLEIGVPAACTPEITASGIVRVTPGVEEPTMVFSVEATGCKYDFNMELLVPPPQLSISEGSHEITSGECGDAPTLALNIESDTTTANGYILKLVGSIPDCSTCCPIDSEVSLYSETQQMRLANMLEPTVALPREMLTIPEFVTGDVIYFRVVFTTSQNRGVKPLQPLTLEFSFNEESTATRTAQLVAPVVNTTAAAFLFAYVIKEDDRACRVLLRRITDPRQNPYYSLIANWADRKVVIPFVPKEFEVLFNGGCSSSSSSSSSSSDSSSSDSSSSDSSSSSSSEISSTTSSSDSSSSDSSSSVSSSSDSSSSDSSSAEISSTTSSSETSSAEISSTTSSSDSSSSEISSTTSSSETSSSEISSTTSSSDSSSSDSSSSVSSSSDSSSSVSSSSDSSSSDSSSSDSSSSEISSTTSSSSGSCPGEPDCGTCAQAVVSGFENDCITYTCVPIVSPDCPGSSSSTSSGGTSSGTSSSSTRGGWICVASSSSAPSTPSASSSSKRGGWICASSSSSGDSTPSSSGSSKRGGWVCASSSSSSDSTPSSSSSKDNPCGDELDCSYTYGNHNAGGGNFVIGWYLSDDNCSRDFGFGPACRCPGTTGLPSDATIGQRHYLACVEVVSSSSSSSSSDECSPMPCPCGTKPPTTATVNLCGFIDRPPDQRQCLGDQPGYAEFFNQTVTLTLQPIEPNGSILWRGSLTLPDGWPVHEILLYRGTDTFENCDYVFMSLAWLAEPCVSGYWLRNNDGTPLPAYSAGWSFGPSLAPGAKVLRTQNGFWQGIHLDNSSICNITFSGG